KNAGTQPALQLNTYTYPLGGAQKGVFLANDLAPHQLQVHRNYLARVRGGKAHLLFALPYIRKGGHKKALPRQHPLAGAHQLAKKTLVSLGTVPEHGLHLYLLIHHHKAAALCYGGFLGVQLYFYYLNLLSEYAVIYFVV